MSAAEKANLARIRDNQRRSRARRKEYLQELEARLRQCEAQGIEASAEIQLAARRVADENKKLRVLLNQHGVGDDNIDAYLQSTASPDTILGQGFGGLEGMGSGAVQVLEHLLVTRKPYCSDGNTGALGPITTVGGSRDSSSGSIGTVQSMWDPPYGTKVLSQNEHDRMRSSGKAAQHHFMTPSSNVSRTGSVVSTGRTGLPPTHQQQQTQLQQQHQTGNCMPSLAPSMTSSASTATTSSQQTQSLFDFESDLAMLSSFQGNHNHQSHNNNSTANQLAQANSMASMPRSNPFIPNSASNNSIAGTNTCYDAIDMISNMAGSDPLAVRADLGCLSNGMDCEVDNQLVFNVMDRFTGHGIGL